MIKIEPIALASTSEIKKKLQLNQPFLIRTNLDFTKRTKKFFDEHGSQPITILKRESNRGTRKGALKRNIPLAEYFNEQHEHSDFFLSCSLKKMGALKSFENKVLSSNQMLSDIFLLRKHKTGNLWLSPPNHLVGLHHDCLNNFNLQLIGKKTFFVAPPQTKGFYTGKIRNHQNHTSDIINLFDFDIKKFPKFSENIAKFQTIETQVGDIVYIPSFWWHQVHTHDKLSVNLNWWHMSHITMLKNPMKSFPALYILLYRNLFERHLL